MFINLTSGENSISVYIRQNYQVVQFKYMQGFVCQLYLKSSMGKKIMGTI